jgi:predicted double-glycine peptidase
MGLKEGMELLALEDNREIHSGMLDISPSPGLTRIYEFNSK